MTGVTGNWPADSHRWLTIGDWPLAAVQNVFDTWTMSNGHLFSN